MQDVIKREITIKATKEHIYNAIAIADQLVRWFPETLEGNYKVGEQPVFGFGEYGKNQVYIVAAKPHEYFAYRWVPGANNFLGDVLTVATTLVEFIIEEKPEGQCKVTLIESGFAALPAEAFTENSGGWDFMLGRLINYIEAA
ncbi:SRPBCC family protein [Dasania marina]|uniref:SRPBCC family protein n=1 Tax=Dasania marina TaxID=471499 RepID=UPI0030D7EDC3|tara:strand:+ start:39077 stop:39505 length:429 start_codon:yes stop_codon:yes gene_type:complete